LSAADSVLVRSVTWDRSGGTATSAGYAIEIEALKSKAARAATGMVFFPLFIVK